MGQRLELNFDNATLEEVQRAKFCGLTPDAFTRLFGMELLFKGYQRDENVAGAVCPATGQAFALTIPYADTETFQVFVDQFALAHPAQIGRHLLLVLDNALRHEQQTLNWHHIEPIYLPPYSPDLNPIEVLWKALKDDYFTDWYAKTLEQLEERVCEGLKKMFSSTQAIRSLCTLIKYQ